MKRDVFFRESPKCMGRVCFFFEVSLKYHGPKSVDVTPIERRFSWFHPGYDPRSILGWFQDMTRMVLEWGQKAEIRPL